MKDLYGTEVKIGDLVAFRNQYLGVMAIGVVRRFDPEKMPTSVVYDPGYYEKAFVAAFWPQQVFQGQSQRTDHMIIIHKLPEVAKISLRKVKERFLDIPKHLYET